MLRMSAHHAILLYNDESEERLRMELDEEDAEVESIRADRFSIDDARALRKASALRPVGKSRVFVIESSNIAPEAQHALLKLFEEPPQGVRFVLVLPRTAELLPTLRSRLHVVDITPQGIASPAFKEFLKMPLGARMEMIAERTKAKDTRWSMELLSGFESFVSAEPQMHPDLAHAVLTARGLLQRKGASAKMLLEDLALYLPQL